MKVVFFVTEKADDIQGAIVFITTYKTSIPAPIINRKYELS